MRRLLLQAVALSMSIASGLASAQPVPVDEAPDSSAPGTAREPSHDDPVWGRGTPHRADDKTLASVWDLTPAEIRRYRFLSLKNARFAAPGVSPIEVLGAFEEDPARRLDYARRFAEELRAHTGRTLRWAIATAIASGERTASTVDFLDDWPEIERYLRAEGVDTALFERFRDHDQAVAVAERADTLSRAVLFTGYDCDAACRALLERTRTALTLGRVAGIDVVFVDTTAASIDLERVERWALDNGVEQPDLDSGLVKLNHDSPSLAELRGMRAAPVVLDVEGRPLR